MELKVIGAGTAKEEIRALVKESKEWISHYAGQQTISFQDEEAEQLKKEAQRPGLYGLRFLIRLPERNTAQKVSPAFLGTMRPDGNG